MDLPKNWAKVQKLGNMKCEQCNGFLYSEAIRAQIRAGKTPILPMISICEGCRKKNKEEYLTRAGTRI